MGRRNTWRHHVPTHCWRVDALEFDRRHSFRNLGLVWRSWRFSNGQNVRRQTVTLSKGLKMLLTFKNLKFPIKNFKMLKNKCQKYNNVIFHRFFVYNACRFSLWSVALPNERKNKFRRSYRLLLVRTAHPSFSRKSFSRTSLNRRVVSALSNAATKKKQSKLLINSVII